MAGEDGFRVFCRRVGGLSIRKTESSSLARAMSFSPSNVKKLYGRCKVSPINIRNLDKTAANNLVCIANNVPNPI